MPQWLLHQRLISASETWTAPVRVPIALGCTGGLALITGSVMLALTPVGPYHTVGGVLVGAGALLLTFAALFGVYSYKTRRKTPYKTDDKGKLLHEPRMNGKLPDFNSSEGKTHAPSDTEPSRAPHRHVDSRELYSTINGLLYSPGGYPNDPAPQKYHGGNLNDSTKQRPPGGYPNGPVSQNRPDVYPADTVHQKRQTLPAYTDDTVHQKRQMLPAYTDDPIYSSPVKVRDRNNKPDRQTQSLRRLQMPLQTKNINNNNKQINFRDARPLDADKEMEDETDLFNTETLPRRFNEAKVHPNRHSSSSQYDDLWLYNGNEVLLERPSSSIIDGRFVCGWEGDGVRPTPSQVTLYDNIRRSVDNVNGVAH